MVASHRGFEARESPPAQDSPSCLGIDQLTDRVRARVAESSCGLCGIDNLEAVARPLSPVAAHEPLAETAIFAALAVDRARAAGLSLWSLAREDSVLLVNDGTDDR